MEKKRIKMLKMQHDRRKAQNIPEEHDEKLHEFLAPVEKGYDTFLEQGDKKKLLGVRIFGVCHMLTLEFIDHAQQDQPE